MTNVVIVSIARTPIAKFCGSFRNFKGSELGSIAINGALSKLHQSNGNGDSDNITIREAFLGNVVSAGMGQAPCRQAVLGAGLPESTICTTINKVCASGMKSVMLATQSLQLQSMNKSQSGASGTAVLAGGFESMSNVPHYLPTARTGTKLGNSALIDGLVHDGLWDVYNDQHMGLCAEKCARDFGISRQEQDEYAIESYQRANEAIDAGVFQDQIVPVETTITPSRKRAGDSTIVVVDTDEEPTIQWQSEERIRSLKPSFDTTSRGTVTAANASSLNDGACAIVLMDEHDAVERGIVPLARILGYADAAQNPMEFTTTPALAVRAAFQQARRQDADIDYHEINEAFSVVALANQRLLDLESSRVNVFGGAVALGHPIGMSGARIIGTLYDVLKHKDGSIGCASICNGGGGASAIVIERLH